MCNFPHQMFQDERAGRTRRGYRQTNDAGYDMASYRVACPQLKKRMGKNKQLKKTITFTTFFPAAKRPFLVSLNKINKD